MRGFIRGAGIILGVIVYGCCLLLIQDKSTDAIFKVIGAPLQLAVATLLIAPERIYQKGSVRAVALLFCLVSGIVIGGSILILMMANPDMDPEHFLGGVIFVGITGIIVPFASAVVLIARVLLARKASRKQTSPI